MPMIKARSSLGANARAFPFTGSQYEYLPFDAAVLFAVLSDTGGVVNASVFSGSDVLLQNSQIDILAVASPIIYPDHYNLQDLAARGERISVDLQEAAGAAGPTVVRSQAMIQPL